MQMIEYVKIDHLTGVPVTEAPARHGPADPLPGIEFFWFVRGQPARYYGRVADDADTSAPGVLRVMSVDAMTAVVEARRAAMLADVAAIRYRRETGGVKLPDGSRIHTDRESQAQLTSAYQSLSMPFVEDIDWKGPDGWVTVTETELRPIAQAVAQHVQGCFKAERRVSEQIDAASTVDDLLVIDLEAAFAAELEAVKAV